MAGMAPLLGKPKSGAKPSTFSIIQALLGIVGVALGAWHAMHYLMDHVHGNPLVVGAYPFIGVGSLILAFPFLMFLAFSKEFNRLNPLLPQDYWFLLNRALTAANRGNMKVTSKEL